MALGRAELAVVRAHAGGGRRVDEPRTCRGPYRMSSSMPSPVSRVPAAPRGASAPRRRRRPRADVVAVHRARQDAVRVAVEPVHELAALVVEVADTIDGVPSASMSPPEALVEVGLAAIGRHRQLARERHAVVAEPVDEPQLDVVPGDGHRAGRGRRRDRQRRGRRRPAARARSPARPCRRASRRRRARARSMPSASRSRHWARAWSRVVTSGNVAPYGRPVARIARRRAGGAVAAAEQVRAQDADAVGVERPTRPDQRLPPVAGRVGRAGQRVDDERPAAPSAGARAVVAVGDGQLRQQSSRRRARTGRAPRTRAGRSPSAAPTRTRPSGRGGRRHGVIRAAPTRARRRAGLRRWPPRGPGSGRR